MDIAEKTLVEEINLNEALMNSEDIGGVIFERKPKLSMIASYLPNIIYWTDYKSLRIRRYLGS